MQFRARLNKPHETRSESSIHKTTPLTHRNPRAAHSRATVRGKTRVEGTVAYHIRHFRTGGEARTGHTVAATPASD